MSQKIVRTVCLFSKQVDELGLSKLNEVVQKLENAGFIIQTKRICSPQEFGVIEKQVPENVTVSVGKVTFEKITSGLNDFYVSRDNVNLELAQENIELKHVKVLFDIIKNAPAKTFNFTYTFNNAGSSPYMPSAFYQQDGFAIGLQSTDLTESCVSLQEWLDKLKIVLDEIHSLFVEDPAYLGIDSSIAPLFQGNSSLINFVKRTDPQGFSHSVTTDIYTQITRFIKEQNPRLIGLSGIMFPCLEDFELAAEYEMGNFSLERNIFLSLHSGLGIDTYPIGVDESPEKVLDVLKLAQALSNKYSKPLAARFVSDGKARIGEKASFNNQYLYDVIIRKL